MARSLNAPLSSASPAGPMGSITYRFFSCTRPILIGENSALYSSFIILLSSSHSPRILLGPRAALPYSLSMPAMFFMPPVMQPMSVPTMMKRKPRLL